MKKGDELIVSITALSSEGKGISKLEDGFVLFVENTLPGDKAKVQILKKKSNYAECKLLELIEKSPDRITPKCIHFGVCGGCKLQNYEYIRQIEFKTEVVRNAFIRIGGFDNINIPSAIKSENVFYYRNKMEFSFSDDDWVDSSQPLSQVKSNFALGLHIPKFHSKILNISNCYLQSSLSADIVNFTRNFFKERQTSIYSTRTHSGFLRFLIIRQSRNTKDFMVNLVTYDKDEKLISDYSTELIKKFPAITTLVNSFSTKKAQIAFGDDSSVLHGKGYIYEVLYSGGKELKFKISPNSFFQTNTKQTETLYYLVTKFTGFKDSDNVLDLYCGAGSIALYISPLVNKVTGVELIPDAIENAEENAVLNGIQNADFILSDIKDFLETKLSDGKYINYNKIILDPPRSGLHPKVSELLSELSFEKICYVSCNPVTQARDLKIICSKDKYYIENVQPVDMFPQTYHVENVVSLSRK